MKSISLYSIQFISAILLLTGCSKATNFSSWTHFKLFQAVEPLDAKSISIVDEFNQPVADAQVLIGQSGGLLKADLNGKLAIPQSWTGAQPVTISASGYVRVTYFGQMPKPRTYSLRRIVSTQKLELSGLTPGLDIKNGDGQIDFAFVLPALQRQDLLHFHIGMIISPENDVIEVVGRKVSVPSNIAIPKQKESYVIPITLEKPVYRTYFREPGVKKVFAARGRLPFKKVISEVNSGKQFYELINYFSITGGSLRDINISSPQQTVDIPVTDMAFTETKSVVNQAIKDEEILVGAVLNDQTGYLFPSDLKNLTPGGSDNLVMASNSKPLFLSVLKRKSEMKPGAGGIDRISVVLADLADGVSVHHLDLLENPTVNSVYSVQISRPVAVDGVKELATYAALSVVKKTVRPPDGGDNGGTTFPNGDGDSVGSDDNGDVTFVENLDLQWEVYAPGWTEKIELPSWPGDAIPSGNLRWSVALTGGVDGGNSEVEIGPGLMQSVTHVSNSSTDFQ